MTAINIDEVYMRMAEEFSKLSHSIHRIKVGCIIVKNTRIISTGFNGTPSGFDNIPEEFIDGKWVTKPEVLHSESNAISKCAKYGDSCNEATLYVTHAPCFNCAKLIIQSGIKTVMYRNKLITNIGKADDSGIYLLTKGKVECHRLPTFS